ncbi:MAG: glycosyltransferase [Nitrososphaerales archaeon]
MFSYLDLSLTILAVLSFISSFLILVFLVSTESRAPQFSESLKTMNYKVRWTPTAMVSVVVAARNEEEMIEDCLSSLLAQTYPNLEIIAVDDSSSDSTLSLVSKLSSKDDRLRSISAGKKPEGWVGKTWPCWRGFEESKGDVLVFVDADSTFRPDLLDLCMRYVQERKIDLFSLGPRVKITGIWARAVLPLISGAINLLYPMQKVNDPKSKRAYVFGTFFLVKREVYKKTAGHSTVRSEIVEDAAIANLVKTAGYTLRVERGIEFLETVWENDFRSIYVGLERVFSSSVRGIGYISLLNAIFLFMVMIYPLIFLLGYVLLGTPNFVLSFGAIAAILNVICLIAVGSFELKTVRGKISWDAILYPLGGIIFIAAIVSTARKLGANKELEWKGSTYKLPDQKLPST